MAADPLSLKYRTSGNPWEREYLRLRQELAESHARELVLLALNERLERLLTLAGGTVADTGPEAEGRNRSQ